MTTIRFRDGQTVPWELYRGMMLGTISPQAAVAQMQRREPAGALDARPSWARPGDARLSFDENGGKLNGSYVRATRGYLADAGVDPDDIGKIMEILARYQDGEDETDPTIPIGGLRGPIGDPEPAGNQDAALRRQAADAATQALLNATRSLATDAKMTQRDREGRGFAGRFPDAAKIRVLG